MAVFTEVTFEEVAQFITPFELGELKNLQGITAGIENTNYFITTTKNTYVLTIFERLTFEQLPFYLELMRHLARKGVKVPAPQAHQHGEYQGQILHKLKGKPAAIVEKLNGKSQLKPQVRHCEQLGCELARMHKAGKDFSIYQPNLRGLKWWEQTIPLVRPYLSFEQNELITSELAHQQAVAKSSAYKDLPTGPVHADLFRDNAMFCDNSSEEETISGFFDFYFAGVDTFIFDIAVCLNDWCIELETGKLDEARANALLSAYHKERQLNNVEQALLPDMMRAGALRFWTSRLWDFYLPRKAQMLVPHNPVHFERVLKERIHTPYLVKCSYEHCTLVACNL